jgi:hypothetical protein
MACFSGKGGGEENPNAQIASAMSGRTTSDDALLDLKYLMSMIQALKLLQKFIAF